MSEEVPGKNRTINLISAIQGTSRELGPLKDELQEVLGGGSEDLERLNARHLKRVLDTMRARMDHLEATLLYYRWLDIDASRRSKSVVDRTNSGVHGGVGEAGPS